MTTPSRAMQVATSYHVSSHRLTAADEEEAAAAAADDDEDDVDGVVAEAELRHMSLSQPCISGAVPSSRPLFCTG